MEFNQKLQMLRKDKNLTQEELADKLFVSRTAVSKWESGRGYPNIESLKALSKLFSVTIDELLSGEQLISIVEREEKQKRLALKDLFFGILDSTMISFLIFPLFSKKIGDIVYSVSIFELTTVHSYILISYYLFILGSAIWGMSILILKNLQHNLWLKYKISVSMLFSIMGTLMFMGSMQPYAAAFVFLILLLKGTVLLKR